MHSPSCLNLFRRLTYTLQNQTSKLRKRKSDAVDPVAEVAESSKAPAMKWKRTRGSVAAAAAKEAEELPTPPDSTMDGDTPAPPIVPGKDVDFGTSASVKVFYEGKKSHGGHYDWVETPPKQLNEKIAKANNRVAIKVFKVKDHEQPTISGRTPLKIYSIEIQSAILVSVLKDILKPQGMYLETSEPAKFQEPFKPLFFTYDKIIALYEGTKAKTNGLLKQHLNLLVQVMDEMFGSFMQHLKHLNASGLISYKLAWTYFPKNTMIFYGTKDCERICRVTNTTYVCHPHPAFNIDCEEIAFDGESFDWTPLQVQVPAFAGNRPVTDLPCYPISFHDDPETVKERLTARAIKALDYQELTYCDYTGVGLLVTQCGIQRHNVISLYPDICSFSNTCRSLDVYSSTTLATRSTSKVFKDQTATLVENAAPLHDHRLLTMGVRTSQSTCRHFPRRSNWRTRMRCLAKGGMNLSMSRLSSKDLL